MDHIYRKTGSSISLNKFKPISFRNTTNPDGWERDFYLKVYPDVDPKFIDPRKHYDNIGKRERRLPNAAKFHELYPHFDLEVYINNNPDL